MTTTEYLAALIGLYFLAAGTGILIDRGAVAKMFKDLVEQPMLGYLGGVIVFVLGGAMVGVHNDWNGFLSGFVSLIGWVAIAEGVLLLAFRKWFLGLFDRLTLSTRLVTAMGTVTTIAGVVLLVVVFGG